MNLRSPSDFSEYAPSASFVRMRIVWYTIRTKIRKGLISRSLLDVEKATDVLDVEPLLVEQSRDLVLQMFRDVKRHRMMGQVSLSNNRQRGQC